MNIAEINGRNFSQMIPELGNLLTAGYYQLWEDDYSDSDAVVAEWLSLNGPRETTRADEELRVILSGNWSNSEMDAMFERLGSNVDVQADGLDERAWLEHVLSLVTEHRISTSR